MQLPAMEPYTTLISDDTICAISTPHGTGGIAVIRISGPDTIDIVSHVWHGKPLATATSHTAHLGNIIDGSGEVVDQAVATVFRGPHSFTGEDVVELSVHGSPYIQQRVLSILTQHGARIAEAGEFTRRAFFQRTDRPHPSGRDSGCHSLPHSRIAQTGNVTDARRILITH